MAKVKIISNPKIQEKIKEAMNSYWDSLSKERQLEIHDAIVYGIVKSDSTEEKTRKKFNTWRGKNGWEN